LRAQAEHDSREYIADPAAVAKVGGAWALMIARPSGAAMTVSLP
jgi:hypothetical protein